MCCMLLPVLHLLGQAAKTLQAWVVERYVAGLHQILLGSTHNSTRWFSGTAFGMHVVSNNTIGVFLGQVQCSHLNDDYFLLLYLL